MPFPASAACAALSLLSLNQTPTLATPATQTPTVTPPVTTAPPTTPLPPVDPVAEATPDYPGAIMTPASTKNYKPANRPVDQPITMIVIHDIEGTAISTVHWFQNPKAQVTAHYIIAGDGTIYQAVKEHNIAWHAGNRVVNGDAVGIEHEGYAYHPGYYNGAEYEASAKLVRSISGRYNIPRDRQHIIGHFEVPDLIHPGKLGGSSGHTDPGPWWDWDSYMTLVRNDARLAPVTLPTVMHPGESVPITVTMTNTGDDPWPIIPTGTTTGADRASLAAFVVAQRAKGLIFLGTWNPATAPIPPQSAFFGTGWVSPRFATPVGQTGDIAPGQDTTFTLTLNAPQALGKVTEQFRLYQTPIAPRLPVAFGPTITATVDVQPYDLVVDATTPGNTTPSASTQWQQALPIGGLWDVYVRAMPGTVGSDNSRYSVNGTPASGAVAMQLLTSADTGSRNGGVWLRLGRYTFDGKQPAVVTLAAGTTPGATAAPDAVRFIGPFPTLAPPLGAPTVIPIEAGPRP